MREVTKDEDFILTLFSFPFFEKAKELNITYNAMLDAYEESPATDLTVQEFKEWVDALLTKSNEIWNKQVDMRRAGKSEEDIKAYVDSEALKQTLEVKDDEL